MISLEEYIQAKQQGISLFETAIKSSAEKCTCCGVVLQESITGYRRIGQDPYCSDDYFLKFSEELEMYPVGGGVPAMLR